MGPRVLMVDDNMDLAEATTDYLTLCGVEATYVTSAEDALAYLAEHGASVILLDVGLPGMSGLEFCRRLRQQSQTPVLFISARDTEEDELKALSIGGDDYIRKPFSMAVLLAKVQRILGRLDSDPVGTPDGFEDDHLKINLATNRVWVDGSEEDLSSTEFRLLSYLVGERGRVVSKPELLTEVWDGGYVSESVLPVTMHRLRARIEPDQDRPRYLHTVRGRGYLFEPRSD